MMISAHLVVIAVPPIISTTQKLQIHSRSLNPTHPESSYDLFLLETLSNIRVCEDLQFGSALLQYRLLAEKTYSIKSASATFMHKDLINKIHTVKVKLHFFDD